MACVGPQSYGEEVKNEGRKILFDVCAKISVYALEQCLASDTLHYAVLNNCIFVKVNS